MKRRFKTELFTTSDSSETFKLFSPTIQAKDSVLVSDKTFRKFRNPSTMDAGFAVPLRRNKK